jgi:hypothetical protein
MPRTKPRVTLTLACVQCGSFGRDYDLGEPHLRAVLGGAWPQHRRNSHPRMGAHDQGSITAKMAACGTVLTQVSTGSTSYDGEIRRLRDVHVDSCSICQGNQSSFLGPTAAQ